MQRVPRHKVAKRRRRIPSKRAWKGLEPEDLVGLDEKLKAKFKWEHAPREFQMEAIQAQLLCKDVLIHAGTGSGKTAVAAGPHVHEKAKGMVTFMVSPLIALQEEQVQTFREEFNLTATAVNSSHHGEPLKEVMAKICTGEWQVVVISPEMMLSKRFVSNVLRNPEMAPRILSVVIDEAHVVSHWGSGFRKKYGTLGILRALLPKGTSFVAMSATLASRVRRDVLNKLQFDKEDYIDLTIGNDRPNVSIVVCAIQNPINTYSDLDFLVPEGVTEPEQIKKTFIYADNIAVGVEIEDRLYDRLPDKFRDPGIIRPYSAAYPLEYRKDVMADFKAGIVRILICTDAAGMGCNIPDIDIVVQWKLPSSISSFVQRAGRAARAHGRRGLAVLLVEKSAYEADLSRLTEAVASKKKGVRQSSNYPKATKQYAIEHGARRGAFGAKFDGDQLAGNVPLDRDSVDKGIYSFIQSTTCRRKVLTTIYGNTTPQPTVPCCDICCPELLNHTRPAPPVIAQRKAALKVGIPNLKVVDALEEWRTQIWKRDFEDAFFGASVILSDNLLDSLSSVGPILTLIDLERIVGSAWGWFGRYGDELLAKLCSLSIPPMQPKPKPATAPKRGQTAMGDEGEGGRGGKRA